MSEYWYFLPILLFISGYFQTHHNVVVYYNLLFSFGSGEEGNWATCCMVHEIEDEVEYIFKFCFKAGRGASRIA